MFEREVRRGGRVQLVFGLVTVAVGAAVMVGVRGLGVRFGVGLPALALGGLWLYSGLRVLRSPWRDDAYDVFGGSEAERRGGARAVEAQIGEEETLVFGEGDERAYVTRDWLVAVGAGLEAIPLRSLLWCYPLSTKYSVNFLPVATVSRVVVYASEGRRAQLPAKLPVLACASDPTRSLLEVLAARAPAAFFGYRPEWAGRWTAVRKAVLAKFEERSRALG